MSSLQYNIVLYFCFTNDDMQVHSHLSLSLDKEISVQIWWNLLIYNLTIPNWWNNLPKNLRFTSNVIITIIIFSPDGKNDKKCDDGKLDNINEIFISNWKNSYYIRYWNICCNLIFQKIHIGKGFKVMSMMM